MRILTPGLDFDAEEHRYYLAGRELIGNTFALKCAGYVDTSWYTEDARERGTRVHKAVEFWNLGKLDESSVHPIDLPYLDAWREFVHSVGLIVEHAEVAVASTLNGFATTIDVTGWLEYSRTPEARAIVEVKTGALIPAVAFQTAGQQIAARENGLDCPNRFAARLRPDGRPEMQRYRSPVDGMRFRAAVVVAQTQRELRLIRAA